MCARWQISAFTDVLLRSNNIPRLLLYALIACVLCCSGCRLTHVDSARTAARILSIGKRPAVEVREKRRPGVLGPMQQFVFQKPAPSHRTQLFLRQNNLTELYADDPQQVIKFLRQDSERAPNMALVHSLAELAELEANWALRTGRSAEAPKLFATAVVHSYQFLFDPKLEIQRNAYDPHFRDICDIYNRSLEGLLRIVCTSEQFKPGMIHRIGDQQIGVEFEVRMEGRWKNEEFEQFRLVSDYEMRGIDNQFQTYGLGVPLIAVRKQNSEIQSRFEKYYPPKLALPMTAFFEMQDNADGSESGHRRGVLKLYDPLEQTMVRTDTRMAPLESDLSVPLAYHLNDPLLNTNFVSTASMLNAELAAQYKGIYMLEPYDPDKIPVVMVHGLWSNPVTWLNMFNDLRAHKWIRDNYQFWFYMYPTGQPFWLSSYQMRVDLLQLRKDVDPASSSASLRQMIMVGHSMGGLVAQMQTVNSGNDFWSILSDQPVDSIKGDPETIEHLKQVFFFEADPSISRVIMIATPHRGSTYANTATRWLSQKIFTLPKTLETTFDDVVKNNKSILRNTAHLTAPTSINSLAPDSPFIQKLLSAEKSPKVVYNNIIGSVPRKSLLNNFGIETPDLGDGVVTLESATMSDAESELVVNEEHMKVHQHPKTILEVKRILVENLVQLGRISESDRWVVPASYQSYDSMIVSPPASATIIKDP